MPRVAFFVALALLTHICVGTEFTAFCELCAKSKSASECPANLTCTDGVVVCGSIRGTCSSAGHIIILKAQNQDISVVPESLNEMTYLQKLNLAENKIESLPVLDQLTELNEVLLYSNKLTNISGVFSSKKITSVNLADNALIELPPELALCPLVTLNVNQNELNWIPFDYSKIDTLLFVYLDQNKLDCDEIRVDFANTPIADNCNPSQQKNEQDVSGLPLSYSGEPSHAGLNAYEVVSIVLAAVFLCLLVVGIVLYIRYRHRGASTA